MTRHFEAGEVSMNGAAYPITDIDVVAGYPSEGVGLSVGLTGKSGWQVDLECTVEAGVSLLDLIPQGPRCDVTLNGRGVTRIRNLFVDTTSLGIEESMQADLIIHPETRFELDLDGETFGWDPNTVQCSRVVEVKA